MHIQFKAHLVPTLLLSSFVLISCDSKEPPKPQQPTQTAQAPVEGPTKVESIVGEANARAIADSNWKSLKVGQKLGKSLELTTKQESSLDLTMANGTRFSLGENALVQMDSILLDANEQKARIDVKQGKLAFDVKKLVQGKTNIEFNTKNMTAAIRGTVGEISDNNGKIALSLTEGEVAVRNKITGKDTVVKANQIIEVEVNGNWKLSAYVAPVAQNAKQDSTNAVAAQSKSSDVKNTANNSVTKTPLATAQTTKNTTSSTPKKALDTAKIAAEMQKSLSAQDTKREELEAQGKREREALEAQAAAEKREQEANATKAKQAESARKQKELDAMAEARKRLGMQDGSALRKQMEEDAKKLKGQ